MKMKVFISWSGELSRQVALVWRDLVNLMFDGVVPFMSQMDIGAGQRGLPVIASELAHTKFGIVVLTQENEESQWLNYESGALSKNVDDETVRVMPSLVDFASAGEATGPIGQFQGKLLNREGVEEILIEIAQAANANEQTIRTRFRTAWDTEYESRFSGARKTHARVKGHRQQRAVIDEILTIVRGLARTTGGAEPPQQDRRLSLPIDIPLAEIRAVLESFLGPDYAGLSITLSSTDDGRPRVVIPLETPVVNYTAKIGEALVALGASASFVLSPDPAQVQLSGKGKLVATTKAVTAEFH